MCIRDSPYVKRKEPAVVSQQTRSPRLLVSTQLDPSSPARSVDKTAVVGWLNVAAIRSVVGIDHQLSDAAVVSQVGRKDRERFVFIVLACPSLRVRLGLLSSCLLYTSRCV